MCLDRQKISWQQQKEDTATGPKEWGKKRKSRKSHTAVKEQDDDDDNDEEPPTKESRSTVKG